MELVDGLDPAGVAVFIAAVCGVIALSYRRPEQWGARRLAFGSAVTSGAVAALLLSASALWFGAILWGLHQGYLGWSYIARRRRTSHERLEYLESSASVLAYVALADGALGASEAAIIRETYARAGFTPQDLQAVERVVANCERQFLADGSDTERLFVLLRNACAVVVRHSNEQIRYGFLRAAILIAASDGFVSSEEERALRASAVWLGIAKSIYDAVWRSVVGVEPGEAGRREAGDTTSEESRDHGYREPIVPPDLATYYASVLGVPVTASPQEVKRAYRDKAKQYHPDVVTHRGPIFAQEAEEKFKELSRAYAYFRGPSATT